MPQGRLSVIDVNATTTTVTANRANSQLHSVVIENGTTAQRLTIGIDAEDIIVHLGASEQKTLRFDPAVQADSFRVTADPTTPAPANVTFHYTR